MSLEVELKLWVTAPMSAALLQQVSDSWPTLAKEVQSQPPVTLLNAYFETGSQWFRRHDAGLRTRCKNGQYQQTIKLAGQQLGAAHVRPEYNQPCAGVTPQLADFPVEIWPEGTDIAALQQQLQELFRTDFVRHCWVLTLQDGTTVEAVLDQGQVLADGRSQPLLEIELELMTGDAQQLFLLAQQLLQCLPLCLGFQSKAERGYRLAQQQPLQLAPVAADPALSFSLLLRQLQQNLWLQHLAQQPEEQQLLGAAIAQQWQQLQQLQRLLSTQPDQQLQPLLQRAASLELTQSTALSLWLLDFSGWLLAQPVGAV
ncbi:inorganic triphosphatase [Rheinheimera riviphila]|nr:CYTH domain-containing protein [Rheinheimera riviphila]